MPLIEEKTGFGSFRLSGQTLRTLRELFLLFSTIPD
jgi:hypothetical protein